MPRNLQIVERATSESQLIRGYADMWVVRIAQRFAIRRRARTRAACRRSFVSGLSLATKSIARCPAAIRCA